jgi:hypothetical protein
LKRLGKSSIKDLLGSLPLTAELYASLRHPGQPLTSKFSMHRLAKIIPEWTATVDATRRKAATRQRNILFFATLRYWIEHNAMIGLHLVSQGHRVTLAYLPYSEWRLPVSRFDLRRHDLYAQGILSKLEPWIQPVSWVNTYPDEKLPESLVEILHRSALLDAQYTLLTEYVDPQHELCRRRFERNAIAARAALGWMKKNRPEVVVIPNSTILEFSAVYQVARYLNIPTVTYEFSDQRQRMWLAQDAAVMRQGTDGLWTARRNQPLTDNQREQIRKLFTARKNSGLWESFDLRWLGIVSEGGEKVRAALKLDSRPIVLLATNVLGDSLTLDRQTFTNTMSEWLERTVQYFAQRPDVQLVIRIHPGEVLVEGLSMVEVVHCALGVSHASSLPAHIHLVSAESKISTYDLMTIADVGMAYTTTAGMEMAMSGLPVIIVGDTHYRGKGFTLDPSSWDEYFSLLGKVLTAPTDYRLTRHQVEQAWNYAYRFFFEYPFPFPWHLLHVDEDVVEWPLKRVLSEEGQERFGKTFRYLSGEAIVW